MYHFLSGFPGMMQMPDETNVNSKDYKADIKTDVGFRTACMEQLEIMQNSLFRIEGYLAIIARQSPEVAESNEFKSKLEKVADILDNGELDGSIKETTNKLFKKRK